MGVIILLVVCVVRVSAAGRFAEPEHLDELLKNHQYEEFDKYMGITVSGLSKPNAENAVNDPRMNLDLHEGDILLTPKELEQSRQGIRFDRYPGNRWPGDPAIVPYLISRMFSRSDRATIQTAIENWNRQISCVQFTPRRRERNYVNFFPGNGCYSNLGRVGGGQPISLGLGCVYNGIILHEMEHAVGFTHEHNRHDRDDFVKVLYENIPPRWRSQYEKNDNETYGLQQTYDYYSLMHYPLEAPESGGKPAFRILQDGIDSSKLGMGTDFTDIDKNKVAELYCPAAE